MFVHVCVNKFYLNYGFVTSFSVLISSICLTLLYRTFQALSIELLYTWNKKNTYTNHVCYSWEYIQRYLRIILRPPYQSMNRNGSLMHSELDIDSKTSSGNKDVHVLFYIFTNKKLKCSKSVVLHLQLLCYSTVIFCSSNREMYRFWQFSC